MSDVWYWLPDGTRVLSQVQYSQNESRGPLALAITSGISLLAVTVTLIGILITGFRTQHQFARSQVGAYFLSLALSDLLQATGSLMNAKWVVVQGVRMGPFCTTQAALKQTGNVGTALWSLVIAAHTFSLLFLRRRIPNIVFYCILVSVWLLIGFVVMMGPVLLETASQGPFWGISGYWCWITDSYHIEQFTDEYLFMFLTAGVSILLYGLIFFRLRGNLYGSGWSLRFCRVNQPWRQEEDEDSQMAAVGKQLLWYPVAYTLLIVPIAACRWSVIFGHKVPYSATMTADSIFMLSGFVNAILYSTTRKIVSISVLLPFRNFIRIISGREYQSRRDTDTSLGEMQFSIPVDSRGVLKLVSNGTPGDPKVPLDVWQPRRGCEFPEYFRTRLETGKAPQWLTKSDSMSVHSDKGNITELHTAPNEVHTPPPPSPGVSPCTRQSREEPFEEPCCQSVHVEDVEAEGCHAQSQTESLSTDTPPLHHKRFSGWSLPSVMVPGHEADSVHTDLEEMRFAPPSPERVLRKIPSRSQSTTDLSSSPRPRSCT